MSALEMTNLTHAQFMHGATPVFAQPVRETTVASDDILEEFVISQMFGYETEAEDVAPSSALLAALLIEDHEAMDKIGATDATELLGALGASALRASPASLEDLIRAAANF